MKLNSLFRNATMLAITLFSVNSLKSQNLLSSYPWTTGTGSAIGYDHIGSVDENVRAYDYNQIGENVVIWKAIPDGSGGAVGGWDSSIVSIDNSKTYRFAVWLKKLNSNDGNSNFGCESYNVATGHQILNLDGTSISTSYFWSGDLPILNRWYLLVGYVHSNTYASGIHLGKVYDGVTGEAVLDITDFKFKNTATYLIHRANLYSTTNTNSHQYFYAPRLEEVNGDELPIEFLLNINPNSSLVFAFDNAGNQKQRFYCQYSAECNVPEPPAGRSAISKTEISADTEIPNLSNSLAIYPNPTKGKFSIHLSDNHFNTDDHVGLYNSNGILIKTIPIEKTAQTLKLSLDNASAGIYFVHIHLSDGSTLTKKIIKN